MSTYSGVKLGDVILNNVKVVASHLQDYLAEHPIPSLEGGISERVGSSPDKIEIHGFLYSGSDADKATLQSYIGVIQPLRVPSMITNDGGNDYYTIYGDMQIAKIDFIQPAGRQYPYYEYMVHGTFPSSGTVGGGGVIYGYPLSLLYARLIAYSQVLPIFASIHPDYSQVLPIGISIHPDYSQVLPVSISIHPDYSQVLPLGASIHANYVRMS